MAQQFIQWEERTYLKIRLNPEEVTISPLGNDAAVSVKIGETKFDALVPTASLGEGNTYVPAQRVGRLGERLVIVLPPSNEGTPVWHIPEDELDGILVR